MNEVIAEFLEEMRVHGCAPANASDIYATDKLVRFDVEGDLKNSLNGWYVLHLDGIPSGAFGSWKSGVKQTWTRNVKRELSAQEKQDLKRRIEADRQRRHRAEVEIAEQARKRAHDIWDRAVSAESHPYLERKRIKSGVARVYKDSLVIPVTTSKGLVGLQFIKPDGEKVFLTGTPKAGAYCQISGDRSKIVICEGYATGCSISEATGLSVIVAFDAGNLEPVAKLVRAQNPSHSIIIACDDDRFTKGNPGLTSASKAAASINAELRRPQFRSDDGKPTDFNDLAAQCGLEEVRTQVIDGKPTFQRAEPLAVKIEDTEISIYDLKKPYPQMRVDKDGNPTVPYCSIENVRELLDRLGVIARYDVIRKDNLVNVPNRSFLVDTEKNDKMSYIISCSTLAGIPIGNVPEYVNFIASQNPYNPVLEWVTSKPWDGVSRLAEFYSTIKSVNDSDLVEKAFKETLIRRWMISAIAAAAEPNGISSHGVLVLFGAQAMGKTSWLKSLVPQHLRLVLDGHTLDTKDKDSVYSAVSHWLVELGEIDATFKKSDISALKSFLTKDKDTIRRPYAKLESTFARRTVFFGSVNDKDYLNDPTGNRRFWSIEAESVNYRHGLDMQQVWAEFFELYKCGEPWILQPEELAKLNEHNKDFEAVNPFEEIIRVTYDWASQYRRPLQVTEVAKEIGIQNPSARDMKSVGKALRDILKRDRRKTDGRWVFDVPPLSVTRVKSNWGPF